MSEHVSDSNSNASTSQSPKWERTVLEKLSLAALQEQRTARRWKIFFRFSFLFLLALMAWRVFTFSGDKSTANVKHTALIALDGEIAPNSLASAENINAALQAAFANHNSVGIILQINSPGGSPVQSGLINKEIHRLRAQYPKKPLYVVVNDLCASGGYYIAVAAEKIFVDKASLVGSIGVRMDNFGLTGFMNKLGIERRLLTAGVNKGFYDPFLPEVPAQKVFAQKMLKDIHLQFIDAVKEGRGKRLKETPEMFSGLFWTGQQSIALGLADELSDVNTVARDILKAETIVNYSVKEGFTDRVVRKFGLAFGAGAVQALGLNALTAEGGMAVH